MIKILRPLAFFAIIFGLPSLIMVVFNAVFQVPFSSYYKGLLEFNGYMIALYLLGSIPFGMVSAKLFHLGDVRKIGSGNIGATNVLRSGNKYAALVTLLGDFLKGFIPLYVLAHTTYYLNPLELYSYSLMPVIGHVFPVWLNFKGGKGIATAFGVIVAVDPIMGLLALGIWLIIAFLTRYSSLASLSAITGTALINYLYFREKGFWFALISLALLTIFTHKENVIRLATGREAKIGNSTKAKR